MRRRDAVCTSTVHPGGGGVQGGEGGDVHGGGGEGDAEELHQLHPRVQGAVQHPGWWPLML